MRTPWSLRISLPHPRSSLIRMTHRTVSNEYSDKARCDCKHSSLRPRDVRDGSRADIRAINDLVSEVPIGDSCTAASNIKMGPARPTVKAQEADIWIEPRSFAEADQNDRPPCPP